jgi:hypothetical protein
MVISAKLIGPSPTFLEHIALPIEAPLWNLNCKIELKLVKPVMLAEV